MGLPPVDREKYEQYEDYPYHIEDRQVEPAFRVAGNCRSRWEDYVFRRRRRGRRHGRRGRA